VAVTDVNGVVEARIAVLGPLHIQVGDSPVTVTADQQRALLGRSAPSPTNPVTQAGLIDTLADADEPRTRLRQPSATARE
jgi:hypothetical protein